MASDPKSLQRLARITTEVDRAAAREMGRRLEEMERRLAALERPGPRAPGGGVDSIRVRTLEGRAADQDASLRSAREEVRELRLRVEAVSTEIGARINTTQMALQEVRRLIEERAAPLKAVEADLKHQGERAEEARREVERRLQEAEPALRAAGDLVETLGAGGAAQVRRLPEVLRGLETLQERLQKAEHAVGQVAAQAEGLVRTGEEGAAVLENLKKTVEQGPSPRGLEERLAVVEKETGRWEDMGDVLLSLREGLGALQKESARMESVQKRMEVLETHEKDIGRISTAVEELLRAVDELEKRPSQAPPDPEVARRLEEHEKTLSKFAGVAEEVLKWMEAMEEQRKALDGALQTLKESPVEQRFQEMELGQAKASGAVEHLLKQVDELEATVERLKRVVMQQAGQRAEG